MIACRFFAIFAVALAPACFAAGLDLNPYTKWPKGPPSDSGFFPLAVWLQAPSNAQRYREAGLNTYVALWKGPTEEHLATLKKAGMRVICHQNDFALRHLDDPAIIGWMHGDEPDNAQSLGSGKGYGPPILPQKNAQKHLPRMNTNGHRFKGPKRKRLSQSCSTSGCGTNLADHTVPNAIDNPPTFKLERFSR